MEKFASVTDPLALASLYRLENENQIRESQFYQDVLVCAPLHIKSRLLLSIPPCPEPSVQSLRLLSLILSDIAGPWPTLDLVRCYTRLFQAIPETVRQGLDAESAPVIARALDLVKRSYESLSSFIKDSNQPALWFPNGSKHITHHALRNYVRDFRLPVTFRGGRKPVVSIALPNGPILAATCLAVANWFTAAPLNPAVGQEQFRSDIMQSQASCVLTTKEDADRLGLQDSWASEAGIQIFFVTFDEVHMALTITDVDGISIQSTVPQGHPNSADDIAIILFTSGTSGTKKVVPITVHSIVCGVAFVIRSWALTEEDVCLNMMPLYHVGGLVRNIFSPIFSGGSTICCPAFEPNHFWDVVEESGPTWYYASPSIHQMILDLVEFRRDALAKSKLRLICNAAGGLLPALAMKLRDTFNCTVLPSYGMTECMPISTPPIDYKLERHGTSGISTGPELSILDWNELVEAPGVVGRICVRGELVFPGYLRPNGELDKSPFNRDGWFDTGDLGYMTEDGYLFVTGRSKEVINRGGEIISPFEVENAILSTAQSEDSPIFGRVTQAMAFPARHDILQEVVGIVLVTPPGKRRVDLRQLQNALRSCLQQAKWPAVIVYMDNLPKRNNKVLRINLATRTGLPELKEASQYDELHWEGRCPLPDTDLSVKIPAERCEFDDGLVHQAISTISPTGVRIHVQKKLNSGALEVVFAPEFQDAEKIVYPDMELVESVKSQIPRLVDGYLVPQNYVTLSEPLPLTQDGLVDSEALEHVISKSQELLFHSSTQSRIARIFMEVLSCPPADITPDADFFALGGDSLRAGKLLSALRSEFGLHLPVDLIFRDGCIRNIAAYIDDKLSLRQQPSHRSDDQEPLPGSEKTYSSTNPFLLLLQLVPLVFIYPARCGFQWVVFIVALSYTERWPTSESSIGRLIDLVACLMLSRLVTRSTLPWVGIAAKWIIIGRYKEGIYPMWGSYHTRWWLVQKIVEICGIGILASTNHTRIIYYRFMGANIGQNVQLNGAQLGEWDLLDIRDGAVLSKCICRPFGVERNTSMYLGQIVIGRNSSVGLSSIVAPGTSVPDNTCIGPNSSSWELGDATESNRDLSSSRAPKPSWTYYIFGTVPLLLISGFSRKLPWLLGLLGLVRSEPDDSRTPLIDIINWFAGPERVMFHYIALALGALFGPIFLFATVLIIKNVLDLLFGKLYAGPSRAEGRGQFERWRLSLMKALFPGSALHELTSLFGTHYGMTSVVLRLLGAKVGRRVYWPGTGPGIGDYHLIDVGNDVVFGSRAHLVTSDGTGSEAITIKDGAMIADRVTCLPGVVVGEETVLGSGAVTQRSKTYPAYGTYLGSKGGDSLCLTIGTATTETVTPGTETPRSRLPKDQAKSISTFGSLTNLNGIRSPSDTEISGTPSSPQLEYTLSPDVEKGMRQAVTPKMLEERLKEVPRRPEPEKMSPFGRAFYLNQASYHVWGPITVFLYSSFIVVFTTVYWNAPFISAIQFVDHLYHHVHSLRDSVRVNPFILFGLFTLFISALITVQSVVALAIVILSKWLIIGRRQPGNYSWDKSSYCQRWQLFLTIERIRRQRFRGAGVMGMLTGTYWCVLYFRALGAKIGRDCALFANGRPSLLFTEPDLLTLGDRVAVDDASLVGHINTRGKFDLNPLSVGDRCVLRTGSRLLSGATMMNDSCLLEHTLVMGGDVIEEGTTMQGWPAEAHRGKRVFVRGDDGGDVEKDATRTEQHSRRRQPFGP